MANGLDSLKVKAFTQDHLPNDYPGGDLPWQTYHTVRNALDLARMLVKDCDSWELGDPDPMYFILDDQMNHEQYCYAELYGEDPFNAGWLLSITETLRVFKGWGLGVGNIPDSYILIFGNRLLVKGRLAKCQTAVEVVEEARRLLKRGDKKWWQFWR